jgi:hypothetical protein
MHRVEEAATASTATICILSFRSAAFEIAGDAFHPEWNYTISPRPQT